jgi:hypothetical protein
MEQMLKYGFLDEAVRKRLEYRVGTCKSASKVWVVPIWLLEEPFDFKNDTVSSALKKQY